MPLMKACNNNIHTVIVLNSTVVDLIIKAAPRTYFISIYRILHQIKYNFLKRVNYLN